MRRCTVCRDVAMSSNGYDQPYFGQMKMFTLPPTGELQSECEARQRRANKTASKKFKEPLVTCAEEVMRQAAQFLLGAV